jgi:hypothetical protein
MDFDGSELEPSNLLVRIEGRQWKGHISHPASGPRRGK